jgi:hypothetical protein
MSVEYADYTKDRVGFFFGMTGPQLGTVMAAGVPLLIAVGVQRWALAGLCLLGFAAVVLVVVVPVRGRAATQWVGALVAHTLGRGVGWSAFRGKVAVGEPAAPDDADLPGILSGVQVHDGPPRGARLTRVAIIQDHAAQTWAATARIVHPGIGIAEARERDRMGEGLSQLIEVLARTDLARMLVVQVRTVPDDGAERAQWVTRNRRADGPALSRRVNDDLAVSLTSASVRTEAFVTVVVAESTMARAARQAGRGLTGRARVLYGLLAEVEAHLLGAVRCSSVDWLDSQDLAAAVRTGFAPSDRAVLVQAAADAATHPGTQTRVPWAVAGPGQASTPVRWYEHDAWKSVSAAVLLPDRGAILGALAPVLVPGTPGERRCYTVFYPLVSDRKASRTSASAEISAATGGALRKRLGQQTRARQRRNEVQTHAVDAKLARGRAMIRPAAVASVTVPRTWAVDDYGRQLESAIRRAGYSPQRLDLAADSGFIASAIPLGIGLKMSRSAR